LRFCLKTFNSSEVNKVDIPVDEICLAVERLNNLKKKVRISEGNYTMTGMQNIGHLSGCPRIKSEIKFYNKF